MKKVLITESDYLKLDKFKTDFFNEVEKDLTATQGGLSQSHVIAYKLISQLNPLKYGEIGSHIGRSAAIAATACQTTQIYCYDNPNSGWGGMSNTDIYLNKTLEAFAKGRGSAYLGNSHGDFIQKSIKENAPYDIFLVDGDHSPEGMIQDFDLIYPLVKENGWIIIDDLVHHPELNTAFDWLLKKYSIKYHEKELSLTEQDEKYGILLRGVGVMQK